ncbi:MAG: 4Fe-4S ferredoxin [Candidatus Eisenbacteria bacterium]|nr:4Fe-4S ferredoxin [Candidatus Eisenbacteria bacterium]
MAIRKIIEIDEELCDGCGLCVPSCHEGALAIVNGKARLVKDSYCDGLGACLGECPQGALRVIEREAERFELPEPAAAPAAPAHAAPAHAVPTCPSARVLAFDRPVPHGKGAEGPQSPSALRNWPLQLALVPPFAPFLKDADLLIAADCVPFAFADFHRTFLAGRAVVVGCPKLDDLNAYVQKLSAILETAGVRSVTVVKMEVPCCGGIAQAARMAVEASGRPVPFSIVTIGIGGEIKGREVAGPDPSGVENGGADALERAGR